MGGGHFKFEWPGALGGQTLWVARHLKSHFGWPDPLGDTDTAAQALWVAPAPFGWPDGGTGGTCSGQLGGRAPSPAGPRDARRCHHRPPRPRSGSGLRASACVVARPRVRDTRARGRRRTLRLAALIRHRDRRAPPYAPTTGRRGGQGGEAVGACGTSEGQRWAGGGPRRPARGAGQRDTFAQKHTFGGCPARIRIFVILSSACPYFCHFCPACVPQARACGVG